MLFGINEYNFWQESYFDNFSKSSSLWHQLDKINFSNGKMCKLKENNSFVSSSPSSARSSCLYLQKRFKFRNILFFFNRIMLFFILFNKLLLKTNCQRNNYNDEDDLAFPYIENEKSLFDDPIFSSTTTTKRSMPHKIPKQNNPSKQPVPTQSQKSPPTVKSTTTKSSAIKTTASIANPLSQSSSQPSTSSAPFIYSTETINQTHANMFKSWLDTKSEELYELSLNFSGYKLLKDTYDTQLRKDAKFPWINFTSMIINISDTISKVLYNKTLIVKNLSDLVEKAYENYRNDSRRIKESHNYVYYDAKSRKTFCDMQEADNQKLAKLNLTFLTTKEIPVTTTPIIGVSGKSTEEKSKSNTGKNEKQKIDPGGSQLGSENDADLSDESSSNLDNSEIDLMKNLTDLKFYYKKSKLIVNHMTIVENTDLNDNEKNFLFDQEINFLNIKNFDTETINTPVTTTTYFTTTTTSAATTTTKITKASTSGIETTERYLNIKKRKSKKHINYNNYDYCLNVFPHFHQEENEFNSGGVRLKRNVPNSGNNPVTNNPRGKGKPKQPNKGGKLKPGSRTTKGSTTKPTQLLTTSTIQPMYDDLDERTDLEVYDDDVMYGITSQTVYWNVTCINRTFDENFKNFKYGVNRNLSTVHVPTNVFKQQMTVNMTAYWTEALNDQFKKNYDNDNELFWQYFCSSHGLFRRYPGAYWKAPAREDFFDCRLQSWYIMAAASPKDVLILLDTSGSMTGLRLEIAKRLVESIMDTLSDNDFFNILTYSNNVRI